MISPEGQEFVGEALIDLYIYRLITSPEVYEDLTHKYEEKHEYHPVEKAKKLVQEFHGYESKKR